MRTKQLLMFILVLQCFGCKNQTQTNDAQVNDSQTIDSSPDTTQQVNDVQINDAQTNDAQTADSSPDTTQTDTSNPDQSAYEVIWQHRYYGSILQPIFADLNLDGQKEILFSTSEGFQVKNYNYEDLPGWPQANPIARQLVWFSYAVTNLDQDPKPEIVLAGSLGAGALFRIMVYHYDGTPLSNWPQDFEDNVSSISVALGDLTGDEKPEIIARTENHVLVWDAQGNLLPGWPQAFTSEYDCNLALGDLDQDGKVEIIFSNKNTIIAWKGNGEILTGFPVTLDAPPTSYSYCGKIVVGDLNHDSQLEIVKGTIHRTPYPEGRYYGMLWIVQSDGSVQTNWQVMPQSAEDYNFQKSMGSFPSALADLDHDHDLEITAGAYAFHHNGDTVAGWPVQEPLNFSTNENCSRQTIGDINGDGEMEIITGVNNVSDEKTLVKVFSHDAQLLFRLTTTDYIHMAYISTPIIGDLDNDGQMEIFAVIFDNGYHDFDINFTLWKFYSPIDNPKLEWPLPNHDPQNTNNYETPLQ